MESANVLLSTLSKPEADSDAAPVANANAAIARFMIMFILSVSFYVLCFLCEVRNGFTSTAAQR